MTMSRSLLFASAACAAALGLFVNHSDAQTTPILTRHLPEAVRNGEAQALRPADATQMLHLALSLPLRNEAQLDAMLRQIYDPKSSQFRRYLTSAEFTNDFAPSQADYDAVVHWAEANGLHVTGTTPNRRIVDVAGPVAAVNRAFHVAVTQYADMGRKRSFFAPDREPSTNLAIPLLAISGLDNATPPRPHYKPGSTAVDAKGTTAAEHAVAHISGSGPGNTYTPSDMRAAYYGPGSLTGAGQTVGIFSYDGYLTSDLPIYFSHTGMTSSVPVNNVLVNGYNGACFGFNADGSINNNTCDDGEQILDIVNVLGMAPGLSQVLFYEGNSSTDVLNKMATDNVAKVLSSSWGGGDFGAASDPIFKQFQAQGQTYLNATGDAGQFNNSTYAPPSVDPYITQVGGTDLTTSGAGGPWLAETAWPESGGGFVSGTVIPTYQQMPGVINGSNGGSTTLRNAPDVAAEADYDNSTVINGVFQSGYGGTSFATPRWAGLVALANQQAATNGQGPVGFLNPAVYAIGTGSSYSADFHDVLSGNNRPTSGGGSGFNAVAGYDLVTGWGSPIGAQLIATLAGTPSASPDYSLTLSPASVTVAAGASGSTTVRVNPVNGFSGSVSFSVSGLPAGVTALFNPVSTSGTSTLTLTAGSTAVAAKANVLVTGVSGNVSHAVPLAVTISSAATGPVQLLGNTGFENGTNPAPWSLSAGVLCTTAGCGGEAPHTGNYFAWLDGYGQSHTDAVSQQVNLPAGRSSATLSFFLHIDTAETTRTRANDVLAVQVLNTSGALLGTVASYSNLNAAPGYTQHSLNLTAYLGQNVTIRFVGTENGSRETSFVLDDVTLTVQ